MDELAATGHTCECGLHHEWPPYVAAHWDEEIIHTCEACGRRVVIVYGEVAEIEEGE